VPDLRMARHPNFRPKNNLNGRSDYNILQTWGKQSARAGSTGGTEGGSAWIVKRWMLS
jgi:hypothetical protein